MTRFFCGFIFLAYLAGRAAGADAPADALSVSNCLVHLDEVTARLEQLEEAASNETVRVNCIADKLNKVRGLNELSDSQQKFLEEDLAEDDADAIAEDRQLILSACARADKLVEEALACQNTSSGKPRRHGISLEPSGTNDVPLVNQLAIAPASAIRDETTCLKQGKLAGLLVEAMGVALGGETPLRALAKLNIEPLGGWTDNGCVTVDDLCVVVARALKLKVDASGDSYSYVKAVRNDGLPVDSLLPLRREVSTPPLLLEAEVRAFLAWGYAAKLPSSRRVLPD